MRASRSTISESKRSRTSDRLRVPRVAGGIAAEATTSQEAIIRLEGCTCGRRLALSRSRSKLLSGCPCAPAESAATRQRRACREPCARTAALCRTASNHRGIDRRTMRSSGCSESRRNRAVPCGDVDPWGWERPQLVREAAKKTRTMPGLLNLPERRTRRSSVTRY